MPKSVTGMHANRGFTLLEIMVVLVVIGITLGFALLSFGDFGQSRRILMASDQFVNTLRLAQQQSVLESSTLGILIQDNSYQIYRFYPPAQWKAISDRGVFGKQYFPADTSLQLISNIETPGATPEIIIHASGDMTAFQLNIGIKDNPPLKTLIGRHDGLLTYK